MQLHLNSRIRFFLPSQKVPTSRRENLHWPADQFFYSFIKLAVAPLLKVTLVLREICFSPCARINEPDTGIGKIFLCKGHVYTLFNYYLWLHRSQVSMYCKTAVISLECSTPGCAKVSDITLQWFRKTTQQLREMLKVVGNYTTLIL